MKLVKDINANTINQTLRYIDDEQATDHIPQPMFIVGSGGSGKTTLLNELISILKERGWSDNLQTFDGKQFFSSRDIISTIENIPTSNRDISIQGDNNSKRRIVIIDDLNFFFSRSSFDDQYLLRNYLNNESAPLIIATVDKVDKVLADYRAPFFEGVRIIYMPSFDSAAHLVSIILPKDEKRLLKLLAYLPPVIRSLKIVSDIVALSDNPTNDIKELINRMSPFYRNKLEDLPVYAQKILYALAHSEMPTTLSELRELTNLSSGTLSTYLRQLVASCDIHKTEPNKRGAPYEMVDPLFKLWLAGKNWKPE